MMPPVLVLPWQCFDQFQSKVFKRERLSNLIILLLALKFGILPSALRIPFLLPPIPHGWSLPSSPLIRLCAA
jgi:hypothetical protein